MIFLNFYHSTGRITLIFLCFALNEKQKKTDPHLTIEKDGKVISALIKSNSEGDESIVAEEIFIMKKSLLSELIDLGATYGWRTIKKDILAKKFLNFNTYAYLHTGYFAVIDDLPCYLVSNIDMLKRETRDEIFKKSKPILTRTKDSVPTKYGDNARVKNSFVADGCFIDGYVENSVIFRNVRVASGAKIKNSVIMQNSRVEENASLNCAVVDKNAVITSHKRFYGELSQPIVVKKGKTV